MEIPIYQIDAFTEERFRGNPAAVCMLNEWLPDKILQDIAAENNLAETAFVVEKNGNIELRWFTPWSKSIFAATPLWRPLMLSRSTSVSKETRSVSKPRVACSRLSTAAI